MADAEYMQRSIYNFLGGGAVAQFRLQGAPPLLVLLRLLFFFVAPSLKVGVKVLCMCLGQV